MEEVNAVNAIVGLNKQIEQLQSKLTSRKVENRQVRANLQLSQGFVDKLKAENERLKDLLGIWIVYIDTDETIPPPISQTRQALEGE